MKDHNKNKESSFFKYWEVNNGWAMSQKLPVNGFELVANISHFNEDFLKNYNIDKTYLVQEQDNHTTKIFTEDLQAT